MFFCSSVWFNIDKTTCYLTSASIGISSTPRFSFFVVPRELCNKKANKNNKICVSIAICTLSYDILLSRLLFRLCRCIFSLLLVRVNLYTHTALRVHIHTDSGKSIHMPHEWAAECKLSATCIDQTLTHTHAHAASHIRRTHKHNPCSRLFNISSRQNVDRRSVSILLSDTADKSTTSIRLYTNRRKDDFISCR